VVERPEDIARVDLDFPVFVKPIHEGSSKGIGVANFCPGRAALVERTTELLDRYGQPVLVEEFLPGDEFTVAILGTGDAARCLPVVGLQFDALPAGAVPVYGYEAKWVWDVPERPLDIFTCPAKLEPAELTRVEETALSAYRSLGCRDWGRVDLRCDAAGVPNVVEVNPLPGILPDPSANSCFPKAARAEGMAYDTLIQTAVRLAWRRITGEELPGARVEAA
jgi:D-alanine-D-alanine ligase